MIFCLRDMARVLFLYVINNYWKWLPYLRKLSASAEFQIKMCKPRSYERKVANKERKYLKAARPSMQQDAFSNETTVAVENSSILNKLFIRSFWEMIGDRLRIKESSIENCAADIQRFPRAQVSTRR